MGSIRTFNPVKLFVGILVSEEGRLAEVESRLSAEYGVIELRSSIIPFTFTDYYRHETGDRILRTFFAFERLIEADRLPEIKHWTNALEAEFAAAGSAVQRPVNMDPGYLENSKVILASTKKAQAASEIAARYRAFNRPDLARHVIERSYAQGGGWQEEARVDLSSAARPLVLLTHWPAETPVDEKALHELLLAVVLALPPESPR